MLKSHLDNFPILVTDKNNCSKLCVSTKPEEMYTEITTKIGFICRHRYAKYKNEYLPF